MIPPSAKIPKEEYQGEDEKEKNNRGDTREEENRKEDRDKTQTVDSGSFMCLCVYTLNKFSLAVYLFIVDLIRYLTWKLPKGLMNIRSRCLDKEISIFFSFS